MSRWTLSEYPAKSRPKPKRRPSRGLRVIVVEDSYAIARALQSLLEEIGIGHGVDRNQH
jgi:hypothetical protein